MIEELCGRGYQINWDAWAAIGTMGATLVALFGPLITDGWRRRRTRRAFAHRMLFTFSNIAIKAQLLPAALKKEFHSTHFKDRNTIMQRYAVDEVTAISVFAREAEALPEAIATEFWKLIAFADGYNKHFVRHCLYENGTQLFSVNTNIEDRALLSFIEGMATSADAIRLWMHRLIQQEVPKSIDQLVADKEPAGLS